MLIRQCYYVQIETNQGSVFVAECVTSQKLVFVHFVHVPENTSAFEEKLEEVQELMPNVDFIRGTPSQLELVRNAINNLDSTVDFRFLFISENNIEPDLMNRVYEKIRKIPKGETRTYEQIAIELGDVNYRSNVRLICLTNNIAYLIPCHRVVSNLRTISGYHWGSDKKRQLLRAEGVELPHSVM